MELQHHERRLHLAPRERLKEDAKHGKFSLVLGAGISMPYGIPSWDSLAKRLWEASFPNLGSPWDDTSRNSITTALPQFLPIVFERAFYLDPSRFVEHLRSALYENCKRPTTADLLDSENSLAVLAKLILGEFRKWDQSRIRRVITFNADDLLQQAIRCLAERGERPVITIGRASDNPVDNRNPTNPAIPIYHLHGFIPERTRGPFGDSRYAHNLIFTDAQYWDSTSTSLSFPNRIMGMALHDSHCLFIGLSMTDINLLRWLAIRHNEFVKDNAERLMQLESSTPERVREDHVAESRHDRTVVNRWLAQHYWLRPSNRPSTKFLSQFLESRGVSSVAIKAWTGPWFRQLIESCFGPLAT